MFIRAVTKKDRTNQKKYTYYRLTHSYRIGNKTRQLVVLNLGKLEGVEKIHHKLLANRIEELVKGEQNTLFALELPDDIENLAQEFALKIAKDKVFELAKGKPISKQVQSNTQTVDLETLEQLESREIGGEWLVKQAFDTLEIPDLLTSIGLNENQIKEAQLLLTAKLLHPSSELETQRWLNQNSGARELYEYPDEITRYKLYGAATKMYQHKKLIDTKLYKKSIDLFASRDTIVIYDLTNMYFQGQMKGSEKADYGRSKEKRNDKKLIGLSLSIDSKGFVRHCQFYKGNIGEPSTFKDLISTLFTQLQGSLEKPLVVMDAGIATKENLALLRSKAYQYDYICVSRIAPKEYTTNPHSTQTVTDNTGNTIELTKIEVPNTEDFFLHIKSDQKYLKENSMDIKLTQRLEAQLTEIKEKLPKKRTLKKISKIHEKVGAIKAKLSRIGHLYEITYIEDKQKDIVLDLAWKRIKERQRSKGEYFLRYTQNAIKEDQIWDGYNLTREVEAVFRCLKTDLDIRPIYHQKDNYIEPHIWLGILGYQVVNLIRKRLKAKNINHSWTKIVTLCKSMQSSVNKINNTNHQTLYIKLCTRPSKAQKEIFDALNFKDRPYVKKNKSSDPIVKS